MNKSVMNIIIIVCAAVVLFVVLKYLNNTGARFVPNIPLNQNKELFFSELGQTVDNVVDKAVDEAEKTINDVGGIIQDVGGTVNSVAKDVESSVEGAIKRIESVKPEDLLPSMPNSINDFAKSNPSGTGSLQGVALLNAGSHIGINTVGQTLRNANLQLRSDPPNPKVKVSPWLNSTIDTDTNRKTFEIGCAC